jgi:hypothetical protein
VGQRPAASDWGPRSGVPRCHHRPFDTAVEVTG